MGKELWKPGNMVYPLPAVMVSCADKEGHDNIITIAWTGTICTNPAMLYISVRPTRYSYHLIRESGEFVVNLTTKDLVKATDWCGVRSGRDVDKAKELGLTYEEQETISVPGIKELPLTLECRVIYKQTQDISAMTKEDQEKFYPQNVDSTFTGSNRDTHVAYYGEIVNAYIIEE